MRLSRLVLALGIVVVALVAFAVLAWRSEEPAIPVPPRAAFDPALVAQGGRLAAIGNCITCHTAPDGAPFAGGRSLATPFGAIVTTNITPDAETGIGHWSQTAFRRAMQEGVDRSGRYLYPAFPYDHFTRLESADIAALYAFVMTRTPVDRPNAPSRLPFPFNQRILLAGWNLLFLTRGPVAADPGQSAAWNRGQSLVTGLGHCGACHTPRNPIGAEVASRALAGAAQEGWWAPGLGAQAQAPVPWTADQMAAYLRTGEDDVHGASAGPMQEVTRNLAHASDADIKAMAAYLISSPPKPGQKSLPPPVDPARVATGRMLFAGGCVACHAGAVPLAGSTALFLDTPDNFIHLVLEGRPVLDGTSGAFMPAFAAALSDAQIAALADTVRAQNGLPVWTEVEKRAHDLRVLRP